MNKRGYEVKKKKFSLADDALRQSCMLYFYIVYAFVSVLR